jgi:hypothetical protein
MKRCMRCKLPLAFKMTPRGKWKPVNPDGSDHWDLCRETVHAAMTPAQRADWERKDEKLRKPVVTGRHVEITYEGDVPPWEEV